MPWKKMTPRQVARELNVDYKHVQEKQKLMMLIAHARKRKRLSQAALAQCLGMTQDRIAQIESGMGTRRVTFDVLLRILAALGYDYEVLTHAAA
ncbi:MAG: helix-turn-helix transcriptional regulator [Myxococcota bacterium]